MRAPGGVLEEVVEPVSAVGLAEAEGVGDDPGGGAPVASAFDEVAGPLEPVPRRPAQHGRAPDDAALDLGPGVLLDRGHEALVSQEGQVLAEGDEVVPGEDAAVPVREEAGEYVLQRLYEGGTVLDA